jgi:hypothetical protein
MAVDVILNDVTSGFNRRLINDNFQLIETALQDALSRSGDSPNTMSADIDLNSNDLINVGTVNAAELKVAGVTVTDATYVPDWKGPWVTSTAYVINDLISEAGSTYICLEAHTSGTFSTDLTANKWELFAQQGSAGDGTGDMLAANNLSDVANAATSLSNIGGIGSLVADTTPQLGGPLDTNSKQINESKGADVASAAALTLGTDGNYFDITGTTSITSIETLGIGTEVTLHFDGILTLTHHSTDLILPNGQNITTYAGYVATFREYTSGDWEFVSDNSANFSGTFTPTITFGGASVGMTYSRQEGSYVKIGNIVFVRIDIVLTAKGSSTGDVKINNLPFVSETVIGINNPATFRTIGITFADVIQGYVPDGTDYILMAELTKAGSSSALSESNFSDTSRLMLNVFYEV